MPMPYSAPALHEGLRLRSRRVRSNRSQRLTLKVVVTLVALAALLAYAAPTVAAASVARLGWTLHGIQSNLRLPLTSAAASRSAPNAEEQRYLDQLWPIHAELERSVVRMGLGAAFYESQDIDRAELKSRVNEGLATYRDAEARMEALSPPPTLRDSHEGYLAAVRIFQQSAIEMLKMFDDGDEAHLAAALPLSLEGTTRLRELADQFWPASG
jgi:hypothetical protein